MYVGRRVFVLRNWSGRINRQPFIRIMDNRFISYRKREGARLFNPFFPFRCCCGVNRRLSSLQWDSEKGWKANYFTGPRLKPKSSISTSKLLPKNGLCNPLSRFVLFYHSSDRQATSRNWYSSIKGSILLSDLSFLQYESVPGRISAHTVDSTNVFLIRKENSVL